MDVGEAGASEEDMEDPPNKAAEVQGESADGEDIAEVAAGVTEGDVDDFDEADRGEEGGQRVLEAAGKDGLSLARSGTENTVSHLTVALSDAEYVRRLEELEAEEDASRPNVCELYWLKDDLESSTWTPRPTEPNPVHDDNPHFEVPQQGGSSCSSNEFLGTTLDLSAFCVGGSQTSQGPQTSLAAYQTSQGSQQSPSQRGGQPQCPRNEYCYPTPPQSEVIHAQDYRHSGIQTPPAHSRKLQREDAPRVQEQQQRKQKQHQQQDQQQEEQEQEQKQQQQQEQEQKQQQQQEQKHHTSADPRVEEDESVAGSREQCAGLSSTQLIGLITCVACSRVFNRAAVCHGYLLQLNRPVQCLCSCVICTLCYWTHRGCLKHSVSSAHGPVNTTASYLAECPQLESVGTWDLGRDAADRFKTGKEVNECVPRMIEDRAPTASELKRDRLSSRRTVSLAFVYRTCMRSCLI
ncbi:hypothetical protein Q5P01_019999 [Channa striata]|uniref:Uncharacterized protein n=1 Tax=Channa striata TaxID=64152 RepID=A0AA88LXH8_CHASR|nr:hypothetical protein Q5P01_019999 [Channa striata]